MNFRGTLLFPVVAATLLSPHAHAADPPGASNDESIEDTVIVTGTRQAGIQAIQSPASIQIIGAQELQAAAGSPDLIQTLATLIPAFEGSTFGGDLSNVTLQARLRGLSPNDTLILINGKRRHTTANLSIGGRAFEGGAAADLDFMPVDAIDHVEVLTDGSAAEYGSDAIAGVINVILKTGASGGNLQGEYGGYMDGGGGTHDVSGNAGFQPFDGAFVNITAEWRHHGRSDRGSVDPRVVDPKTYPDTNELALPGYPYLNQIQGDADQQLKLATLNSGFELAQSVRFYAFGSYGKKYAAAYENYRTPSEVAYDAPNGAVLYQFPFGFSPLEAIDETDYQVNGGLKGALHGWYWDAASGYGRDDVDVSTIDSTNISLFSLNGVDPPSSFDDGGFEATQWTSTLDLDRDFTLGLAGALNVAFGGEYRRETYSIVAGVPASYYGTGAAAYPGFNPIDAGTHARDNSAAYVDFAAKPIEQLRLDAAGRFEHYSDFGSRTVGKIGGRYDFTPELALRGTVSTGFRAPTLAEEYYTTTNVTPTSAVVQLAPNSRGAKYLGLGSGLGPETSTAYSAGFVFRPQERSSASLDAFYLVLRNRIVPSGTLNASLNGVVVAPAITQAIVADGNSLDPQVVATGETAVSLFTNGIDTKTLGADLDFDHASDFVAGTVDWSIRATYNDTTAFNIRGGTPQLAGQPLFDRAAIAFLTTAAPRYVLNIGPVWIIGRLSVSLRELVYGNASEYTQDSGYTDRIANISPPQAIYYKSSTGVLPITDVNVNYNVLSSVKLSVGAINVFNRYPDKVNQELLALYDNAAVLSNAGVAKYTTISPIGIDGGYYYVRASYGF